MNDSMNMLCRIAGGLLLAGLLSLHPARAADEVHRPNILLIYADDLGWDGLSCYGNRYHETPHLDQLAMDGMRFTQAYSGGPVCAPSRAVLLSGQYVPRHGIYRVNQVDTQHAASRNTEPPLNVVDLRRDIITLADSLRAAGYATGYAGKWHLGYRPEYLPGERGFEEALVTRSPSGKKRYFFPTFSTIPEVEIPKGAYLTDVVTDFARSFIDKDHGRPFFLYLPYFNVHGPHEARPEKIAYFQKKDPARSKLEATYAAMHAHLDDAVGILRDELIQRDLLKETLILFTSDNGALPEFTSAFKGGKAYLYEGGLRVPMIATWPGTIAPGALCDTPVHQVDLYPTFLELAHAPAPEKQILDGVSLAPLLAGKSATPLENRALYWHFPTYIKYDSPTGRYLVTPCSAIREGRWKLVHYFTDDRPLDQRVELYDLETDPEEKTNLAGRHPEIADRLLNPLNRWREETGAPMPSPKLSREVGPPENVLKDATLLKQELRSETRNRRRNE